MKRIIRLTERDLTRIVKRVMSEATEATPAMTGEEVAIRISKMKDKIKLQDDSRTNMEILTPTTNGNNSIITVKGLYELDQKEKISLIIPGCETKQIVGPNCSGNIFYEINCTFDGKKGPTNQRLKVNIPNRRINGCD